MNLAQGSGGVSSDHQESICGSAGQVQGKKMTLLLLGGKLSATGHGAPLPDLRWAWSPERPPGLREGSWRLWRSGVRAPRSGVSPRLHPQSTKKMKAPPLADRNIEMRVAEKAKKKNRWRMESWCSRPVLKDKR